MTTVCVIGHFGGNKIFLDGQTVKAKTLTKELKAQIGEQEVMTIDTFGGARTLIKCFVKSFFAVKNCRNIIMLPAHNGVRFFTPVLLLWNKLFRRKLHYSVIGGWLPEFLKSHGVLCRQLKKFDYIYVETTSMKKALVKMGFSNVSVIPNCKELDTLNEDELVYASREPYRLCTFSRICEKKGIAEAIEAVKLVNEKTDRTVYTLDIYGQVDPNEVEWFEKLKSEFPSYVTYGGLVPFDKSVEVLKNYFALVFPTKFYTEGIPGTIIDAYASGVPVISSEWQNFGDIVTDGETGVKVEFESFDSLVNSLLTVLDNPEMITNMKKNCIQKATEFLPGHVIGDIIKNF